jgi:hypothetical protein
MLFNVKKFTLNKRLEQYKKYVNVYVPDRRSRDLEVVVVRRTINLGTENLGWGGNGKGLRKGRSV